MFAGRGPGRVVEIRVGADRTQRIGDVGVVSKISAVFPHRYGGAPEVEVGVLRAVGPVVRGIRLHRRQGEGAGKTEARDNGHRAGGTGERAAARRRGARSSPAVRRRMHFEEKDGRPGGAAGGQAVVGNSTREREADLTARLGSARLGSARLGSARLIIAESKRSLDVKPFFEKSITFLPPRRCYRKSVRASTK